MRSCSRTPAAFLVGVTLGIGTITPATSWAQAPLPPNPVKSLPFEREPLPQHGLGRDLNKPVFNLPRLPEPASGQVPLSDQPRTYVREYRILGNSVLNPALIEQTLRPYVGRLITTAELQELRRKLTLLYIENGYLTSGVILPDQQVRNGIVHLQVIEGTLAKVEVTGLDRLSPAYVQRHLSFSNDRPINLSDLQRELQLLQLDPNITRLDAILTPSERLGSSTLALEVDEVAPIQWVAQLNNHRSPSIGSLQGKFDLFARNIAGRGDLLTLGGSKTEGLTDGSIAYSAPIWLAGPTFGLFYQTGTSEVIEQPFSALDVESEFDAWSVQLSHPLHKSLARSLQLSLHLDRRKSTTFLLGEPFSFSPGVDNGTSRVSVARLILDWYEKRADQVFALRSTLNQGVDLFGATINDGAPDGRFSSLLLQMQYARRIWGDNGEFILRSDLQLSADPLLPIEKFGIGGAHSVRGYRENQLVADNGFFASLELRSRVLKERPDLGKLQIAAFSDFGRSWDKDSSGSNATSVANVGLGLRWEPDANWFVALYGAVPFRDFDHDEHDLQDAGVHFSIGYRSH